MSAVQEKDLAAEVARLDDLGLTELREVWRKSVGPPPRISSTELTRRWLAWELQARRLGGLDPASRRRLRQLGKAAQVNPAPAATTRALRPGTVLTREWNGKTHRVMVLEQGFDWNDQQHASLSAIACRITGTRWSGPRFFGLHREAKL